MSHMDPGWQDLPAVIMERHAGFLDHIVELCDKTKDEPAVQRFVYTCEMAWAIDYYERHRSREQFEKLMACPIRPYEADALHFWL